jgi:hypothetical protein
VKCATHVQRARDEDVHDCVACRRALEEQRAIKALLAQLPAPTLASDRRAALAAEVMARADVQADAPARSRRPFVVAVGAALLAAAVVLVVGSRDSRALDRRIEARVAPAAVGESSPSPVPSEQVPVADEEVAVPLEPPTLSTSRPPALAERGTPPVTSPTSRPPAPKKIDGARQVFGATTDKQHATIERDTIDVQETGVAAFRRGWEALRAQQYADAIAAFDRATDPAVAEDAAFWSAIAAQRAGDLDDARKRLDSFLSRFPSSPRADDARRAREVLR